MADWSNAAEWWVPTIGIAVVTLLGLVLVRRRWAIVFGIVGALAIVATVWQQTTSRAAFRDDTARLQDMVSRLDQIGRLVPGNSGAAADDTVHSVAAGIAALNGRIKDLEGQVAALQARFRERTIDDATAAKLEDYLRGFGSHRVVVSCVPGDVEAYDYANRLVTILRAAGWDAQGPEQTKIFGAEKAMPIGLYVHGDAAAQTANILTDAFARFNIPYQSRINPNEAIPDPATVELFVASKPS